MKNYLKEEITENPEKPKKLQTKYVRGILPQNQQ
jgi:hypothetical protein